MKLLFTEIKNKRDLPLTKVFDPREGLTIDDSMTKEYDEKLDHTLEVWAQAELNIIRVNCYNSFKGNNISYVCNISHPCLPTCYQYIL